MAVDWRQNIQPEDFVKSLSLIFLYEANFSIIKLTALHDRIKGRFAGTGMTTTVLNGARTEKVMPVCLKATKQKIDLDTE